MVNSKPTSPVSPIIWSLGIQLLILGLALGISVANHTTPETVNPNERNLKFDLLYSLSASPIHLETDDFTPGAIMANKPLTVLPFDRAKWIFFILSAAAVLAGFVLCIRTFLERSKPLWPVLTGVVALAISYPFWKLLNIGAADGVAGFLFVCSLYLFRKGGPETAALYPGKGWERLDYFAGAALALAAAIHPRFALLLIPVVLLWNYKLLIGFAAATVAVLLTAPRLWIEFFSIHFHLPAPWFALEENGSLASVFYTLRHVQTFGQVDDPLVLASGGILIFIPLLLLNLFLDLKRTQPSDRANQAALVASYLPFALTIPATVESSALVLNAMILPLLGFFWLQSDSRLERIGLIVAAIGSALTQSQLCMLRMAFDIPLVQMIPACGSLILITGLTLFKFSALRATDIGWTRFLVPAESERLRYGAMAAGLTLYTWVDYACFGFSHAVALSWLFSLTLAGLSLAHNGNWSAIRLGLNKRDARICAILFMLFFAAYAINVAEVPIEVATDELNVVGSSRVADSDPRPDWLGLNHHYFNFANGGFLLIANASKLLGGQNLENGRRVHAVMGLFGVLGAYVLLRQFLSRRLALSGALLVGCNHTLLAISRTVLNVDLPVFLETIALAILVRGLKQRSPSLIFFGGAVAGLGVYSYYAARMVFGMWLALLFFIVIKERSRETLKSCAKWALISAAGFLLSTAPMTIANFTSRSDPMIYARSTSVLFDEGRQLTRDWEDTTNTTLALLRNTAKGLVAFNSNTQDHGNEYVNPGYGFVDPLTGILLWVGVAHFFTKRRRRIGEWLIAAGFFTVYFALSFLANKNPNYTRLLVILPFALYFALDGARVITLRFSRLLSATPGRRLRRNIFATFVTVICCWNGWIYYSHVQKIRVQGEPVGETVRFAVNHQNPEQMLYVCTDDRRPYLWGGNSWRDWIWCCLKPEQKIDAIHPGSLLDPSLQPLLLLQRPCTILMRAEVWKGCENRFRRELPDLRVQPITNNQSHLAIELP